MTIGLTAVAALLLAERARPLRRRSRPYASRLPANLALGAGCAAIVYAVEEPLCQRIARGNEHKGRGLAQRVPRPLRLLVGVAAMDYGFYLWHVATHKVPFLWHWHRVHHADRDLDASTAIRFLPVDMLISLPWRLSQVRFAGVDPRSLRAWRHFFNVSILFHHSNWHLPGDGDRRLAWLLTTPEMHGIHHSVVQVERDSNWSSGFSVWDRLHGTLRQDVAQEQLIIGVREHAPRL